MSGIDLTQRRVFQLEPNLTALLPGTCQARCPFCVEPEARVQATSSDWMASFRALLEDELPPVFQTLTLSGGEPSLSPVFHQVLQLTSRMLQERKLRRVVLTTNGHADGLHRHLDLIGQGVTHVNISRHAASDTANRRVFRSEAVPGKGQLHDVISQFNQRGLPVNLNCVYSDDHLFGTPIQGLPRAELRAAAKRFISFAKEVGASSVVFRKDHRVRSMPQASALEEAFIDYKEIHRAQCESCRVSGKIIRGLPVHFKTSLYEPGASHDSHELYELVHHADGRLYCDWSRQQPVRRPIPAFVLKRDWHEAKLQASPLGMIHPAECDERRSNCGLMELLDSRPGGR